LSLPATMLFAIRTIRERQPHLDSSEICSELRRRNWQVDDAAVEAFLSAYPRPPGSDGERGGEDPAAASVRVPDQTHEDALVGAELDDGSLASGDGQSDFDAALESFRISVGPARAPDVPAGLRPEWPVVISEIDEALRDEIDAVSRRWQDRRVGLKAGRLLGTSAHGMTVRWEADAEVDAPEGASVHVVSEGSQHEAEVVRIDGTAVTLHVWMPPTSRVVDSVLVMDASFLGSSQSGV
jgi:hypothetical protein